MDSLQERYNKIKRELFRVYYRKTLNEKQIDAVCTVNGPLLVLSGAGSGKTTVLVRRIAHMIEFGDGYETNYMPDYVNEDFLEELENAKNLSNAELLYVLREFSHNPCPPSSILAITFTNKAAKEMKERLGKSFDNQDIATEIVSGTFHSICLRILHIYGNAVGLSKDFSIYDTDDKKKLVAECMKELEIDEKMFPIKDVCNEISHAKDNLIKPQEFIRHSLGHHGAHVSKVYELYQKKLIERNSVDFDDMIMLTVEILKTSEKAREYYQNTYRYVCVDEYQDTNVAQFELTKLLSGKYRNIMVVGDDDQSIYKFRGATVTNILQFDRYFADAKVVKLEQNYRSTKTILNAANSVISNNLERHEKKMWTDGATGEKIVVHRSYNGEEEAQYIVDTINYLCVHEKHSFHDFAVLYRLNELSREFESAFTKSGIPYRILGNLRFFDRKEIKDMSAYLFLICNHKDTLRLKRIVNEPKRKIGDAAIEKVDAICQNTGKSFYEIMENAAEYPELQKESPKFAAFVQLINECSNFDKKPSEFLSDVFKKSGYERMLLEEGKDGESAIDHVMEYISYAVEYEKRQMDDGLTPTIQGFLEEVALITDVDKYDDTADAVVLMTIHASKGLEFPIVFLPGMEENIFPSSRSLKKSVDGKDEVDEERRLAYVALTRAKEKVYIIHTETRIMYAQTQRNRLSRFVEKEIPQEYLQIDASKRYSYSSDHFENPYRETPQPTNRTYGEHVSPYMQEAMKKTILSNPSKTTFKKFSVGDSVKHTLYGKGIIKKATSYGADVLYEIEFENGQSKKLMATFAKLTPAD